MKLIHKYYKLTYKTKRNKLIKELTKQQEYCKQLHNRTRQENKTRIQGYLTTPFSQIKLLVISRYIVKGKWVDKGSAHLTLEDYENTPCFFVYDLCRGIKPAYKHNKNTRISPIKYVLDQCEFYVKSQNKSAIYLKISKLNDVNTLLAIYNSYGYNKIKEQDDFIILKKNINT